MVDSGIPAPCKLNLAEEVSAQTHQWEEWIKELNIYFEAAAITAVKRKRALLLYLGGEQVRNIYETYDDTEKTFETTQAILNTHFAQRKNLSFERFKFHSSTMTSYENALAYITRLKKLARSCDFDQYSPEDALVDHFITTCGSSILRRKLLSEEDLNLDKLLKIVSTVEVVDTQIKVIENGNLRGEVHGLSDKQDYRSMCFGCGSFTHRIRSKDCPASGITCFKCGVLGHYASRCIKGSGKGEKVHLVEESKDESAETLQTIKVVQGESYLF